MQNQNPDGTPRPLPSSDLRRICDPEEFSGAGDRISDQNAAFVLADDMLFVGKSQKRFLDALDVGMDLDTPMHHIGVAGVGGAAALETLKTFVEKRISRQSSKGKESLGTGMCYTYNFKNPWEPCLITLKNPQLFQKKMQDLLAELKISIPSALTSLEIETKRQYLWSEFQNRMNQKRLRLFRLAKREGIVIQFTPQGAPVLFYLHSLVHSSERNEKLKIDKKLEGNITEQKTDEKTASPTDNNLLSEEEWDGLDDENKSRLTQLRNKWFGLTQKFLNNGSKEQREIETKIEELNLKTVEKAVSEEFSKISVRPSSESSSKLIEYLDGLKAYTIENYLIFMPMPQNPNPMMPHPEMTQKNMFLPWQVNVFVDYEKGKRPVVVEHNPTYDNLIGVIGRESMPGGMFYTDHTMIRPGSLASANNGYLIVDLRGLVTNPGSYLTLKRALKMEMTEVQDLPTAFGYGSLLRMRPEPAPLRCKVIVAGSRFLWNILSHYDEEFLEIFGVKADVAPFVDRIPGETSAYAAWMRNYTKTKKLAPFAQDAVSKMIEYASRLAGNKNHLSTDCREMEKVMLEAAHIAVQDGKEKVGKEHIVKAVASKFERMTLGHDVFMDMLKKDFLLISVEGKKIGQINALAVQKLGDIEVGMPSRLTAQVAVGSAKIINIQREANLAGSLFKKADLTVRGFLRGFYARYFPLSLDISFAFEQSYGPIDGDSASLAELCAILSSVTGVPLRQDLAITGSMNLLGEVQPIGGVNEKIEGFFDACRAKGPLSGTQGVMIPYQNIDNLMLREDVIEACENGSFHVWPLYTFSDAIKLLTGMDAGERDTDNDQFPYGSFNALAEKELRKFSEIAAKQSKKDNAV